MVSHPIGLRRGPAFRGDPFLGKLFKKAGKALKKITLKGAVKAVGGVARTVLPIVAPGVGSVVANLIPVPRAAEPAPAPAPVSPEMVEPQVAPPSATATMTQQEFDELVQHFVNQIIADAQQGLLRDARMRF
jgi:hypothetical protein